MTARDIVHPNKFYTASYQGSHAYPQF